MIAVGQRVEWNDLPEGAVGKDDEGDLITRQDGRGWWLCLDASCVVRRRFGRRINGDPGEPFPWVRWSYRTLEVMALGVAENATIAELQAAIDHAARGATAPDVGDWVLWDDVPVNTMVREVCPRREGVATHLANGRGTWTYSYGRDSAPTVGGGWDWRGHCDAGMLALVLARVDANVDVFKLQEIARVAMASELIVDRWAARVSA